MIDKSNFRKNAYDAYILNSDAGKAAIDESTSKYSIIFFAILSGIAILAIVLLKIPMPVSIDGFCNKDGNVVLSYNYMPITKQDIMVGKKNISFEINDFRLVGADDFKEETISTNSSNYFFEVPSSETLNCIVINNKVEIFSYKRVITL